MRTVLVTGSTGMLGRALCGSLKKSCSVLGVSRGGADGGLRCDLSKEDEVRKLFDAHPIDLVVHTAAYSGVDDCENNPSLAHASNALAPKNLSGVCDSKKIPWIHVSTDYVFDGLKRTSYVENDRVFPISIYGQTKLIGEFYAENSVSPCAVVRTSWLFGPENPRTFVNMIAARLKTEDSVSVLDNQTTAPTSVKDLSLAIAKIAEYLLKQPAGRRWNEIFHVCNRGGTTHLGMTEVIRDILGRTNVRVEKTDPGRIPGRVAIRPEHSVMSTERFEKTFGLKMRPWQESLREYLTEKVSCVNRS